MGDDALPCWIDGRLQARARAALRADDSAFLEGIGCYTTARVSRGAVRWLERHVRRLEDDARRLELGPVDTSATRGAFAELAEAAFSGGDGALRFQISRDGTGERHLVGVPRSLGAPRASWRAISAPLVHEGAQPWSGVKLSGNPVAALARRAAAAASCDEALLFDRDGYLIEAGRSNLVVVLRTGEVATPDLERGGVAGIARGVALERVSELRSRDIHRETLAGARELIALNALRGAKPIVSLDGSAVGDGSQGPLAKRLDEALARD